MQHISSVVFDLSCLNFGQKGEYEIEKTKKYTKLKLRVKTKTNNN